MFHIDLSLFNKENLLGNKAMYFLMACICAVLAYMVYLNQTELLYNSWSSADWALTYAGGFVRRGLSGEIALAIAKLFSINIVHAIFIIKTIIYSVLAGALLYIINKKKINLIEAIYFFLPWGFSFYLTDFYGSGKKELLFLSFFLIYIAIDLNRQVSIRFKFIYLFLTWNFMLLMHEAQFFFLQLFLLYEILHNKMSKVDLLKLYAPLSILALCCFLMLFIYKGDSSHVAAIWKQLEVYELPLIWIEYGSIGSLEYADSFKLKHAHIINYTVSIIFLFMALTHYSKFVMQRTNFIYFFIVFCISLPLYFVAMDWGRWIHIFFLTSFLCVYSTRKIENPSFLQINKKNLSLIVISVLLVFISLKIIPLFHTYPNQPADRLFQIYEIIHAILN